jgi:hypothetical protein
MLKNVYISHTHVCIYTYIHTHTQVRGLTTEAVNLLLALNSHANVIPQVANRRDCEGMLLRTFPAVLSGQLLRLLHKLPPRHGRTIQVRSAHYSVKRDLL